MWPRDESQIGMSADRLLQHLNEIDIVASRIQGFIEDMAESQFASDEKTQSAVMMGLVLIGEAVAKIDSNNPGFLERTPDISWRQLIELRDLIFDDAYRIDSSTIWNAASKSIPDLKARLSLLRNWRAQGE